MPPPVLLASFYAGLVLLGGLLLSLPLCNQQPIGLGQALFTAVSAVTVTGLTVVDTGSQFSVTGQIVILTLIQLGGIGLMSVAVLVLSLMGMQVGLRERIFLREDLHHTSLVELMSLVWIAVRVALVCELVGALLLAARFVPVYGWPEGIWQAVFHAVSAFNNAGFSLSADSLSGWVDDPLVNLVVGALIVIGGIGYVVLWELGHRRSWRRLSLHARLTLGGSVVLWVTGTVLIAALEWRNPGTLGGLGNDAGRVLAAWFQSVTTRTAGFNTLDIAALHQSTALLMIVLMLIGGGTTSTAGGLKVTTLAVLFLATLAFFRRRPQIHVFGRSLQTDDVMKVLALTVVAMVLVTGGTFVIALSNPQPMFDLAFEVVSAFGTVGLSRGLTADLDALGQGTLAMIMFIGRMGPLTLGVFLATRSRAAIRYPAGRLYLG
ncbi:MAG: TrkH family potassium uptake protein [Gammaproteobacteria bacterium]|nr:TrkH family potassium uptake protein [Gammaproteobacteria bacterium]